MLKHSHKFVSKSWGSELWIVNKPAYCGKILTLEKGKASSIHRHILKDETMLVFDGKLRIETWEYIKEGKTLGKQKKYTLRKGNSLHIPANLWHRFTGIADRTTIIEFSTHHQETDVVRLN